MDVIVDAYNVIFKVPELGGSTKKCDIEDLRNKFLLLLKQYKAKRKHKLTVVFDGKGHGYPGHAEESGIDVVFSRPGLNADEEIKRMVSSSKQPKQIIVVSSDRDIQQFVKKYGSKTMDALVFYSEVTEKIASQTKTGHKNIKIVDGDEPMSKYLGPSKTEAQYWLKVFSDESEKLSND